MVASHVAPLADGSRPHPLALAGHTPVLLTHAVGADTLGAGGAHVIQLGTQVAHIVSLRRDRVKSLV